MLFIILFFVAGGWLIGKMISSFIPDNTSSNSKNTTIINNYETNNHLHITDEQLRKLKS